MTAISGEVHVMRVYVAATILTLVCGGTARAQTTAAGQADCGYAEAVLQSSFGT